MRAFTFILLLAASAVWGAPTSTNTTQRTCGNDPDPSEVQSMESTFSAQITTANETEQTIGTITVPVYFHVIRVGTAASQGNVPDAQIRRQMIVLNNGFKKCNVKFVLKSVDRTTNPDWFSLDGFTTPDQTAMKNKLHQGTLAALNVYSVGKIGVNGEFLGYATFPFALNLKDDGVVILHSTMPGGTLTPFNLGKTLTHEVGHWGGLYHTFTGGCADPGDFVDDTPAEANPAFGCPINRDTCPGGGKDPIHNFMDFSDDSCMNQFTKGQCNRWRAIYRLFRK